MMVHHESQGPIPICEMLTSDQTTPNLTNFSLNGQEVCMKYALIVQKG